MLQLGNFRDARNYAGSRFSFANKQSISNAYTSITNSELSKLNVENGSLKFLGSKTTAPQVNLSGGARDAYECTIAPIDKETWDACCSSLPHQTTCPYETPPCCHIGETNMNCHFLPFLEELKIVLEIPVDGEGRPANRLTLDQDGILRPYDVASILWPAGYILTLCVSAPIRCGIPELATVSRRVLELAAGIGAPSSVLSYAAAHHELVIADFARHALALARDNLNPARRDSSQYILMDHFNSSNIDYLHQWHGQFDVVLGASLAGLYEDASQLQFVLEKFVKPVTGIAILAQPIGALPLLDRFAVVHKVSSAAFGMVHPYHSDAEFEIVVLRKDGTDEL